MNSLPKHHALSALLIGALMISFSGVWVKVSHVPPTVSAFYRVFFGGLILLAVALLKREIGRQARGYLGWGLLCGFLFALDLALYHHAVAYVGPGLGTILPIANALPHIRASLSGLILLLQPALAFVWDVPFFQRPTSLFNWAGVLIALVAIYLGTFKPEQSQSKLMN